MSARNVQPRAGAIRARALPASGRPRPTLGVARLAFLALVLAFALLTSWPDRDGPPRALARTTHVRVPAATGSASLLQTQVTVPAAAKSVHIPASFFGLSTEYWALPKYDRQLRLFARILSFLHVQGGGPMILRIGGDSADLSFWDPTARVPPSWVYKLSPPWLRAAGIVVRNSGLRLILDLNLVTGSPLIAAQWARVAEQDLPRRSILAFEVGNEPDIYSRWYWRAITARAMFGGGSLPRLMSAAGYVRAFRAYVLAIGRSAPGVPLVGPALANPLLDLEWVSRLLAAGHRGVGMVSAHRYPYSACAKRFAPSFPTVERLLSEHASAGMAQTVRPAAALAHRARLPFRLTELNSVTCRGRRGVSDTFATALWAPDALFELRRGGVDGVNLHLRAGAVNAPFLLTRSGLDARPLLYGMILFARTLGPDARLLEPPLHVEPSLHLKVWAVRAGSRSLRVLVIDKGSHPIRIDLRLPARGPATVQRLLAPSAWSRSGVTLGGQHLRIDGTWAGRPVAERIIRSRRGYWLTLPRESAALVSVHLGAVS